MTVKIGNKEVQLNDYLSANQIQKALYEVYKQGYQDGGEDMEKAKQIIIDCLGNVVDTYKTKMFELMSGIDESSAQKDIVALRRLHYNNMDWLKNNFLINEYYDYFYEQLKEQKCE